LWQDRAAYFWTIFTHPAQWRALLRGSQRTRSHPETIEETRRILREHIGAKYFCSALPRATTVIAADACSQVRKVESSTWCLESSKYH